MMRASYVGVDVQSARRSAFAVLDDAAAMIANGWLEGAAELRELTRHFVTAGPVVVGIDAPRVPLTAQRRWGSARGRWVQAALDRGRHCEVVVRCLGLANPQWTPRAEQAPAWMMLGFEMFRELTGIPSVVVHEVFPSASYAMFEASPAPSVTLSLGGFTPGVKDMLDAVVAAVTVKEFAEGRGCEVGGGDGLGTIVLPCAVPSDHAQHPCLTWPT